MLSQGQHSSALCLDVCGAGQSSIQTAGMAVPGSSKISSPVAWNALLLSCCPSLSFPNFPSQLNADLIWGLSWPLPLPTFPPITFNHCAHHSFGSCLTTSHVAGWSFPWYRERASQSFGISHTWWRITIVSYMSFLRLPPQNSPGWLLWTTETCFFTVLEAERPRPSCQYGQFLLRPLSLTCWWQPSPWVFHGLPSLWLYPNFLFLEEHKSYWIRAHHHDLV